MCKLAGVSWLKGEAELQPLEQQHALQLAKGQSHEFHHFHSCCQSPEPLLKQQQQQQLKYKQLIVNSHLKLDMAQGGPEQGLQVLLQRVVRGHALLPPRLQHSAARVSNLLVCWRFVAAPRAHA